MKIKHVSLALALVGVAAIWFGRLAWRAHHNMVTLHARNMPLAEVVRSLERQTWEKIRYDKNLAARITLNVKNAPLDRVLNLVADRAGARWQKTFAVASSGHALAHLESVLDGAAKWDDSGWTNLAPQFADLATEDLPGPPDGVQSGQTLRRAPMPGPGGGGQGADGDDNPRLIGGGQAAMGGGERGARVLSRGGRTVTFLPGGATDQWSAERLVLETSLLPRLKGNLPSEATPETADDVASTVHGRARLYYALAPAPFGMGMGHRMQFGPRKLAGPPGSGQGPAPGGGDIVASMTAERRQARLRELSRSPEEQVERARQRSTNNIQFQTVGNDEKTNN